MFFANFARLQDCFRITLRILIVKNSILIVKNAKAVVCRCSVKKDILRNFGKNSQENTCARDSFLIKLQALGSLLRISDTGVFLWIFWNIREHLFYRTPPVAVTESLKVMSLFRIFTLLLQIPCISFDKHASSAGNESVFNLMNMALFHIFRCICRRLFFLKFRYCFLLTVSNRFISLRL